MAYRDIPFVTGGIYHVFNRSIEGKKIFNDLCDFELFISRMLFLADELEIEIHAWTVLPNHFHILLQQTGEASVSKFMHRLGLTYAMYFNRKHKRRGPLFESRFKAVEVCSEESYARAKSYIENNAVKHELVKTASDWPFSNIVIYLPNIGEDDEDDAAAAENIASIDEQFIEEELKKLDFHGFWMDSS